MNPKFIFIFFLKKKSPDLLENYYHAPSNTLEKLEIPMDNILSL